MSVRFLGPDPVDVELNRVLEQLAQGRPPRDIERRLVDCKEEPGRRRDDGSIQAGGAQSEHAAQLLAEEAASFANSAGGGALVVGFADRGDAIGTLLDAEALSAVLRPKISSRTPVRRAIERSPNCSQVCVLPNARA